LTVFNLSEFWAVQLEVALCVFAEMLPLYYLMYQHVSNFEEKEENFEESPRIAGSDSVRTEVLVF